MLAQLKQEWQKLRDSQPGERFQAFYDRRQQRRGGTWSWSRVLSLVAAVALIVAGPVVGLIPGPGGLVVLVFGVALLAAEFRPAAQLLDWLESKLRVIWTKMKQLWFRRCAADRL